MLRVLTTSIMLFFAVQPAVAECWERCARVPGGVWCEHRCVVQQPPVYYAPPQEVPQYAYPAEAAQPRSDPLSAVAGALGLPRGLVLALSVVGVVVAFAMACSEQSTATQEVTSVEAQTQEADALRAQLEADLARADAFIAQAAADAYWRGRQGEDGS